MFKVLLPFLALPSFAVAQGACPADPPAPDPCLVGNWIGANSALAAFEAAMEGAAPPGVSVDAIPGPPPVLGMTIYEDGFYATLPFHADALTYITDRDGTSELSTDLSVPTQIGHIWGDGSALQFCDLGSAGPMVLMEGTAPDGATGSAAFGVGPGGYAPDISYVCSGDTWTFTVALPAPIGPVEYTLHRFPDDMFEEEFRSALEDRFGR